MGKQIIFSIIFWLFSFASFANDSTIVYKPFKIITGDYKNFALDNLGNLYLINTFNQIKKLNNNLDSIAVFNDTRQYGNITNIDVNNPLKILIYYGEFSTILVLDRFLNVRNKIDLRKKNIFKASAISLSYDNNIWLFDEIENKVKKISDEGMVLMESNDFRLVLDSLFVPETIIDNDGKLFLYNTTKGFLISDYYGAIKKVNPLVNLKYVQLQGNKLIGFQNNKMMVYSLNLFLENEKNIVGLSMVAQKVILKEKFLYQILNDRVEVKIVE